MSCSANRLLPGLAAAAGIGAFVLPLVAPWHLLAVAGGAVATTFSTSGRLRLFLGAAALAVLILVLLGHIPSPLAAAVLSAAALSITRKIGLAVIVLLLDLSATATAQELIGNSLHLADLEAAAPAILAALALMLVAEKRQQIAVTMLSGSVAIGVVWLANKIEKTPEEVLTLGALPIVVVAAVMGAASSRQSRSAIPACAVMVAALTTWGWTPPKSTGEHWILLPEAPDAYEAKYFTNYVEALAFAGIRAKKAFSPEDIPPRATVLMPWLTAPFPDDQRIGELARERHWTVVASGEHTNMGEIAVRMEAMAGRPLLRRDLTVPPGNTDDSGPLRTSGIVDWPHESILNRGASVIVSSPADKILLAGDGWWAEPDIGEWLWVGDYVWHPSDRAGRLALAAITDINGARWLVLGDNSPMLNRQLIADPRGATELLQAASLWPAFLHDLLLTMIALAIVIHLNPIVIVLLPMAASLMVLFANSPSQEWRDIYLGESGFDERNFNNVLVDNPSLFDGRRLIRMEAPVEGLIKLPDGPATIFFLVDQGAEIGGVRLDRCHRLGSLPTSEGPSLMDGQACRVEGKARVLIGTATSAAAIALSNGSSEVIVILDTAFLGQKAPKANIDWLRNAIEQ